MRFLLSPIPARRPGAPSLAFLVLALAVAPALAQEPRTPLERSDFQEPTSHAEMVEYLREVKAEGDDMGLEIYGRSHQGRELYKAIFSRTPVQSPAEARSTGKPIVLLAANIHGFNRTLREALLIMLRDLGTRGSELNELLDEVIVLVVPSKNPDGLEADTRYNIVGADPNRDYMALEEPETAAYVGQVVNRWRPHLLVDGHDGGAVQYGGAYPYALLYQGPALAGADPSLTELADREIFPRIDEAYEAEGLEAFYWAQGDEERWYGGGAAPRMGRNYGGLANTLSILFEHAEWQEKEEAVEAGILAYTTVLRYARDHGDTLVETVETARRRTVELGEEPRGEIPVEETAEPEDFRVTYRVPHPERDEELLEVEDAEIVKRPVATRTRARPYAYVLPPTATEAVALLQRHGIAVERVIERTTAEVTAYALEDVAHEESDNRNRSAVSVTVASEEVLERDLPWGAYVVRTGQELGRVAAHLLEPETGDGLVHWNALTPLIPKAEVEAHRSAPAEVDPPLHPVYKIMEPGPLPTKRVRPSK